ncbi:hypothetical protein WQ59_02660 [Streptomyces sp. KE1]|nr:hypothetical protein WQ59_02660 [Streptomyces sp. KE1]
METSGAGSAAPSARGAGTGRSGRVAGTSRQTTGTRSSGTTPKRKRVWKSQHGSRVRPTTPAMMPPRAIPVWAAPTWSEWRAGSAASLT